jgi:hypothetical protein
MHTERSVITFDPSQSTLSTDLNATNAQVIVRGLNKPIAVKFYQGWFDGRTHTHIPLSICFFQVYLGFTHAAVPMCITKQIDQNNTYADMQAYLQLALNDE